MAITMDGIFVNGQKVTFAPENILTGDASAYTQEIGTAVEAWMEENVTGGEQVTDTTLTLPGVPADAKKTGDEIEALKEDLNEFDNGRKPVDVDMEWSQGFINADGSIDTTVSTYYVTRKIAAEELNGGVITSNPSYTLYAYRYKADGSYIFGYLTIGKVSTFNVPSDYFGTNTFIVLEMSANGYSGVSAKGFEKTKAQAQLDELKAEAFEVPKVVMIDKIVTLESQDFDVHYDNIFVNYRSKDIAYKELFGNVSGIGMADMMRLNSATVGSGVTASIRYRNSITSAFNSPNLPDNVLRKAFTVDTIALSSGSGLTRKVLLIGDSWTAPGKYASELRSLFESANEPMNIELLGTLGNGGAYVGPTNGFHEGHGAYSSKTFCTKSNYNGYNNLFYNPSSQTFDFSYYMTQCGYTNVDDVFINLGINDVAEMQDYDDIIGYWDTIVNSIKAFDSNIRVFIGLCGLPAQYEYGYGHNNNCDREKARRLLLHERLLTEYFGRESEKIIVVPLHLSIDSEHDFPTEQRQRSLRDATLVEYCTDYVHPTIIAYNKIADTLRIYIKYAETI